MGESLDKSQMHELGLVAVLLSSKYEDVSHISLKLLLKEAGHGKFAASYLTLKELEVFKCLGFNLSTSTIYEET